MEKSPRPAQLETTIKEIIHDLLAMAITPHVRELRAKAVTYGRVINNWSVYPPTAPQVQAMLECVTELHEKVHLAKREVSRVSRRPSHPANRRVSAPIISSAPPPGWNANVNNATTGVRPRSDNPDAATPIEGTPTVRPPPGEAISVPPMSAPRAVDSGTPVPSLLRSRRSR